ncbi:MAG: hypothetical protein U5O39_19045 [Gammaproteobacteria bacterium]|nr:hypothetical protein [Gammaproteobacteria bacterium]
MGIADLTANGAGGSITLDNAGNNFGSVSLDTTGNIVLREAGNTQLDAVAADNFTLDSAGNVTDGTNASVVVTSAGVIDADGAVTLGDEAGDTIFVWYPRCQWNRRLDYRLAGSDTRRRFR